MKFHFRQGYKYYNMQTQLTLFGDESLVCSWGSVNGNRGNHKIIECSTPSEMHDDLKRVIKRRKNRGYNIPPSANSKTKLEDTTINNIAVLTEILENPEQFKIVKKYQKPDFYKIDDLIPKQIGVFLDTETTDLSYVTDKVLELGMVKFEFCKDGHIYRILDEFNGYQDPNMPIAEHITKLTGITDDMVRGKQIKEIEVANYLKDVDIIIAHNAQFDRPFFDKMFPGLPSKAWACSRCDIDWREEGIESHKLEYIAYKYNFYYEGHRAVIDCLAGLHILAQDLKNSQHPALKHLLTNAEKLRFKIWAKNAPFYTKDILKERFYRWSTHQEGFKAWYTEVGENQIEEEINFLRSKIYNNSINIPIEILDSYNRFSPNPQQQQNVTKYQDKFNWIKSLCSD
jgi:DNA polymerase-3 subunit epsilon